ncbi:MAG: T9SS type A sorting domain-containing protein [Chitinophagales bacterium]|nr:T9SS type A sorting domain-containing protein [Chitinophagales bacterium]MCZ2394557.1 T9SS type A sorting domain-containing protein [Chitinophagales bacterium]
MKLFCSLLLIIYAGLVNLLKADDLQPKITPEELGYTDKAYIDYFEKIDDDYLGMVVIYVKDGYGYKADWVYNLKTKEARNTTYTNETGQYNIEVYEYHTNNSLHGLKYFLKEGNWIYTIVSGYSNDSNGNHTTFLLGTHLETGQQNARLLHEDCLGAVGFIQSAGKNFLIETEGCGKALSLLAFDDSTWNEVWSVQDFGWDSFINYETKRPFYHKDKIYLSAQDKLYVFNTSDYKTDTIIEDTRDIDGVKEGCVSVPTQYFAYGDDIYIVYNDVKSLTFYVITYGLNAEGNTRIWKTDGTKNGTTLIKKFTQKEGYHGILTNSKLFELDDRLLWLGDMDTTAQSEIYEVKGKDFESLGKINFVNNNISGIVYNMPFRSAIPMFGSISPVRFEHQDVLPYIVIVQNSDSSSDISHYLNVVGIEGNQVKQYLANYPIDPNESQWSYSEYRCWNVGEKLTVFRHHERPNEDLGGYTTHLDFLVSESYRNIDFERYNPLTEGAWGILSIINVENEVLFGATDKEGDNFIIWSWDGGKVTQVINQLSEEQLHWTIYPNPTSSTFTIQSKEHFSGHLIITGADGKAYQTLRIDGQQKKIDVSQLPNGIYVAIYQEGSHAYTKRFIIQR